MGQGRRERKRQGEISGTVKLGGETSWMEEGAPRGGGGLRGQGSSLWCEVAGRKWARHVAALREAGLARWKRRLGRRKQRGVGESAVKEECRAQGGVPSSISFLSYISPDWHTGSHKSGLFSWHGRLPPAGVKAEKSRPHGTRTYNVSK